MKRTAILLAAIASNAAAQPTLYVSDVGGGLWTVSPTTGSAELVGNMGLVMRDIAVDATGEMYGVSASERLYRIDRFSAEITLIGILGIADLSSGLDFSPDGTLYMASADALLGGTLYTIDTNTGVATGVSGIGFNSNGDLAFETAARTYLSAGGPTFNLVAIDLPGASTTLIGAHGLGSVTAMDFVEGNLIAFATDREIHRIDPSNATTEFIANINPPFVPAGASYFAGAACNPADLAPPFGVLDLADTDAFITAFLTQDPTADLAPPTGIVDLADIDVFIAAFLGGCP